LQYWFPAEGGIFTRIHGVYITTVPSTTQSRLHYTYLAVDVGSPGLRAIRVQASTGKGSTPTCHCGSPLTLNSQHQPPTGRQQPAPGTSSMCPWRIFRPAFRYRVL